jgi:uracil-DNA glycosylase family 4
MESVPEKEELARLIGCTRAYLLFMQELGIYMVPSAPAPVACSPSEANALDPVSSLTSRSILERNADAAAGLEHPSTANLAGTIRQESPRSMGEDSEMTRRSEKSLVEKVRPVHEETLFGEILLTDPGSLPKPGESLPDIHNDIGDCTRCPLFQGRTHVVNSEGNPHARLMFVGEAPGADEDAQARPFVGRAGQLLSMIIEAIGFKRDEVFIGNVNRCRPPQNRTPTITEAATCKPFLLREIAVVKPEVIVVLGNTAMKNLLDTKEGITKLRGTFQDYNGTKVMPTFHPAYLLRDPSKKRETWADMKKVRDYLDGKIKD